jgi:hypothetical protein
MCAYLIRFHLRGRNVDENLSTPIIPYFVHKVNRTISPIPLYHKTQGFSYWFGGGHDKTSETPDYRGYGIRCNILGLTRKHV